MTLEECSQNSKTRTLVLFYSAVHSPVGHIKWEHLSSSRQYSTYIKTIQKLTSFLLMLLLLLMVLVWLGTLIWNELEMILAMHWQEQWN